MAREYGLGGRHPFVARRLEGEPMTAPCQEFGISTVFAGQRLSFMRYDPVDTQFGSRVSAMRPVQTVTYVSGPDT